MSIDSEFKKPVFDFDLLSMNDNFIGQLVDLKEGKTLMVDQGWSIYTKNRRVEGFFIYFKKNKWNQNQEFVGQIVKNRKRVVKEDLNSPSVVESLFGDFTYICEDEMSKVLSFRSEQRKEISILFEWDIKASGETFLNYMAVGLGDEFIF